MGQKILVDRILLPRHEAWFWPLGAALGGAALTQAGLEFSRGWVIQRLQTVMDLRLVQEFTGHLLRLPLSFFLQRQHGDLIQRIDSNSEVQTLFTDQSVVAILDGLQLLTYAALMVSFSPRLGSLVIGLGMVRVFSQLATRKTNERMMTAELAATGGTGAVLMESLSALETIKAAGVENAFIRRWAGRAVASGNAGLRRRLLQVNLSNLMGLLADLGTTIVLLSAGWDVLHHRMSLGTFSAFLTLQGLFLQPLGSLLDAFGRLQFLGSHLQRLDDVLDAKPEPSGTHVLLEPARTITLEDVSFSYPGSRDAALTGLDLEVAAGEMVALVGPSGAGKSTLARLMLGLHHPGSGAIRFSGIDLRCLDVYKLRRTMGVVMQEPFLLNDTILANLSLADPALPMDQLVEAARLACILDEIHALPGGFQTVVGENGSFLSGGQRQRLALARALATRPSILLLDEATSSLDPETEARVHANLSRLGCTRVLIAHRLTTVRNADRILVLDQGRIVQRGTFAELVAHPGLFRSMATGAGGGDD
jgi:ABC-type bacteriocin/lantibiotic exporter with double-glycine peptidase domain